MMNYTFSPVVPPENWDQEILQGGDVGILAETKMHSLSISLSAWKNTSMVARLFFEISECFDN